MAEMCSWRFGFQWRRKGVSQGIQALGSASLYCSSIICTMKAQVFFFFLMFWPRGLRDLNSLTRD